MFSDFRRTFCPTEAEKEEDKRRFEEILNSVKLKRGCSTCKKCIRFKDDPPPFVFDETHKCKDGLKCDTVFYTVENCKNYEGINYD